MLELGNKMCMRGHSATGSAWGANPKVASSIPTSAAGNWARVFHVTGGNINHYTTADLSEVPSMRYFSQEESLSPFVSTPHAL